MPYNRLSLTLMRDKSVSELLISLKAVPIGGSKVSFNYFIDFTVKSIRLSEISIDSDSYN